MSDQTCSCCGTDANRADEQTDGGTKDTNGTSTDGLDQSVPAAVGDLLSTAYGMESNPETLDDLVDGLQAWARSQDIWPPSFEDLCHAEDTRHSLQLDGETHHFACVIDPMMVSGIRNPDKMVVRSESPVEGAEIEIRFEDGEAEVTPSTAVLSLGAARSIERLGGDEFAPEEAYAQLCTYGNAFPNRTTYDAWADETSEAETMAITMDEGVELARALVAEW